MRARVTVLRKQGRRVGQYGTLAARAIAGTLGMHSQVGGEQSYTAVTLKGSAPKDPDLLPPLYEPVLVTITNGSILLRGYESFEGASFVQEWHCEFD
jgi:hypothetical protein